MEIVHDKKFELHAFSFGEYCTYFLPKTLPDPFSNKTNLLHISGFSLRQTGLKQQPTCSTTSHLGGHHAKASDGFVATDWPCVVGVSYPLDSGSVANRVS